ncbi:MAG TPA: ribose-phosphate pyrophosphokinase [Phycisphaerae bacterium]|nr:ribose-phosphate pyrophosphokinase [Phycisphaerae bacterium]HOJ75786.1 ribose-phosphate pyrophosphokinase [Phycisphaerae bacterium]HOM51453.1 ribose-phosphate pyrophosphokinase [Phycisphaerae bacterium]HON66945.1 ribose-phosphate pyrophosphokinase [Phycisphaerae bacterium]HOQ86539.1 ribose-phosphate pyrophosphokinase [Phycisphaerae bacterium]
MTGHPPDFINSIGDAGLKIFGGSSNPALTQAIAQSLGVKVGRANIERFPDGETLIKLEDDVRGRDCFIVQSTCPPVNEMLVELLIFIDCLIRASARRITAVIPYFGYARQDRKAEGRTPITAKLVANLITQAGAHRVLAMDLHAEQIQGFFDLPVDHLTALPVITEHIRTLNIKDGVVVSPDVGNLKKATRYAQQLQMDIAVIDKRRVDGAHTVAARVMGEVKDKTVLLFDDMITTGGTATEAIRVLRENGAKRFLVAATHPVFAPPAIERLEAADVDWIVVTDTIPLAPTVRQRLPQVTVLTVSRLLGEAIRRIHLNQSVSALFNMH